MVYITTTTAGNADALSWRSQIMFFINVIVIRHRAVPIGYRPRR